MSNKGVFCAVLVSMGVCAPYGGSADGIYTLKQSITSGGIDLTALDGAWRKDALAAEASGTYQPIAVTGKVVHATSAGSPFVVSNALEKTYFVLEGSDLLGNTPVKTTGKGTIYFSGVSMTNIGDTAQNDLICATDPDAAKGATQIDSLCLSGTAAPARYEIVSAPLYVRYNTYLGADGGRGELYATKRCLGRDNDQTVENPWLGRRGNANLYFGYASGKDKGFASGRLHLVNALAAGWYVYFGHADNGVPAASGPHYAAEVVLEGKSARMQALWYHVAGSADSIIRFRGGHLATFGWGNFLTFDANSSGDLILEGENGYPIDLKMTRYAEMFSWGKDSTGRCIFRGDCDVYLYGGDGAGQNDGIDTAGGVRYRDPERRVVWEQTGDLCFFYGGAIAKFFTDDFFPCNPWNGGVKVVAHATQFFALNLLGTSHRCNSLFGGGIVSNSYEKTSVVTIGENGNDCLFDVVLGEDGPIDIVKEGAGRLTLEKPVHDTFTLAGGTAVIPEGSTFATPANS